jgi:hypothetical protein
MAIRATCWWHDHPAVLGGYEVADEVVRELVATLAGHRTVVLRTSGRNLSTCPWTLLAS